jgi:hypothetical protein
MSTRWVTIQGTEFEVDYEYHKAHRGAREGGLQLEPDEDSGVEIEGITTSCDIHELLSEELVAEIASALCTLIEEPPDDHC